MHQDVAEHWGPGNKFEWKKIWIAKKSNFFHLIFCEQWGSTNELALHYTPWTSIFDFQLKKTEHVPSTYQPELV